MWVPNSWDYTANLVMTLCILIPSCQAIRLQPTDRQLQYIIAKGSLVNNLVWAHLQLELKSKFVSFKLVLC